MFTHIIWDFDGTLFDTYPIIIGAFQKALGDFGVNPEREFVYEKLKISVPYAVKFFSDLYSLDKEKLAGLYRSYSVGYGPETVKPFPYAEEFCSDFKRHGGTHFIFTHRGDTTFSFLEYHGMLKYFTEVVTKSSGFIKPEPEGFLYFAEKYGIKSEDILVIGDRDIEVIGAKRAGMKSCLFDSGGIVWDLDPDYTIRSLKELYSIFLFD